MNSSNFNVTAETINTIIDQAYETYVYDLITTSAFTLICYAAVLEHGNEVEYMWRRRFSLPTLLYLFTRYGGIIDQAINLAINFIFTSLHVCNILADVANSMSFVTILGIQGLLIARAYSLSRGNKILAGVLGLSFALSIISLLFRIIKFNGCNNTPSASNGIILVTFISDLSTILVDLLVFSVCVWGVWGTFKLKRISGVRGGGDLVFTLVKQSILRCCFVLVSLFTCTIIELVFIYHNTPFPIVLTSIFYYQDCFSAILVANFTLDLRRQNATGVDQVTLPTLQFRTVLQHVHQSFVVELRTPGDSAVHGDTETESSSEDAGAAVNEENTNFDRLYT